LSTAVCRKFSKKNYTRARLPKGRRALYFFWKGKRWFKKWPISGLRLGTLGQFGQASNFTGACAFVQDPLFYGLVDGRLSGS
jgi:hypothetical protein